MRFRVQNWLGWLALVILVGCASTPPPQVASDLENRAAYEEYARQELSHWEERVEDAEGTLRSDLMVALRDARAEWARLQQAPDTSWRIYRDRLNGTFNQMTNWWRSEEIAE